MQLIVTLAANSNSEGASQLDEIVQGWIVNPSGLTLVDEDYEVGVDKVEDATHNMNLIREGEKQRIRRALLNQGHQPAADYLRDEVL